MRYLENRPYRRLIVLSISSMVAVLPAMLQAFLITIKAGTFTPLSPLWPLHPQPPMGTPSPLLQSLFRPLTSCDTFLYLDGVPIDSTITVGSNSSTYPISDTATNAPYVPAYPFVDIAYPGDGAPNRDSSDIEFSSDRVDIRGSCSSTQRPASSEMREYASESQISRSRFPNHSREFKRSLHARVDQI